MGGLFGGGSNQTTTQLSNVVNQSTTDAQHYNTINVNQNGLTSSDAANLLSTIQSQQKQAVLSLVADSVGGGGNLILIIVLLFFAAIVFRR